MRRRASELFGLVAYLSVMYGRLPDRELLAAAWSGDIDLPERPRLRLVVDNTSTESSDGPTERNEVAA